MLAIYFILALLLGLLIAGPFGALIGVLIVGFTALSKR